MTRDLQASSAAAEEGTGGAAASSDLLNRRPLEAAAAAGAGAGEGAFADVLGGEGLGDSMLPMACLSTSAQGPNWTTLKGEKSSTLECWSFFFHFFFHRGERREKRYTKVGGGSKK